MEFRTFQGLIYEHHVWSHGVGEDGDSDQLSFKDLFSVLVCIYFLLADLILLVIWESTSWREKHRCQTRPLSPSLAAVATNARPGASEVHTPACVIKGFKFKKSYWVNILLHEKKPGPEMSEA